jgi:hypothetical protein
VNGSFSVVGLLGAEEIVEILPGQWTSDDWAGCVPRDIIARTRVNIVEITHSTKGY